MNRHAICYFASQGYLFETLVSASQARAHASKWIDVFVVFGDHGKSQEREVFEEVARANHVKLVSFDLAALGVQAKMGRLYLADFLPAQYTELLYLDGDTQIVGNIDPLMALSPGSGRIVAARDPMTFIREVHPKLRTKIDSWMTQGGISKDAAPNYVNSGMLRLSRDELERLRGAAVDAEAPAGRKFVDQDIINVASLDRVTHVSIGWNFPGFLIGTPIQRAVDVRVIHFMSNPRPWRGVYAPWGKEFHQPYEEFVARFPSVSPFWDKDGSLRRLRYAVQQLYKAVTERRTWSSSEALEVVAQQEGHTTRLSVAR